MKKYKSTIGISVSQGSVALSEIKQIKGEQVLVRVAVEEVDVQENIDQHEATVTALQKAMAGFNVDSANIVCIVNDPQCFTMRLIMPNMPKKELLEALRWEIKDRIAFSVDKVAIDFDILEEVTVNKVKKLSVIVSAVDEELVEQLLKLADDAGLKISAIIPVSIAYKNLTKNENKNNKTENIVANIEFGEKVSELNIFKGASFELSRKLPITETDITNSLMVSLASSAGQIKLNKEEAERIIEKYGIAPGKEDELIEGKITRARVFALIRPKVEQLATEIERSFHFYHEQYGGKIEKIVLFGKGAKLKGLAGVLFNEFEIEIETGDPFNNLKVHESITADIQFRSSALNLSVGAALNDGKGINHFPSNLRNTGKRKAVISLLGILSIFLLGTFSFFGFMLSNELASYEKKLIGVQEDYQTLIPQAYDLYERILLEQDVLDRPYWDEVLKELSNVVPFGMYFTHLEMKESVIYLKGAVIVNEKPAEEILTDFMSQLEKGMARNVILVETKRKQEESGTSEFEIKFNVQHLK